MKNNAAPDLHVQAFQYLHEHWHIGMPSITNVPELLGINRNTFKTRIARGQALTLREPNGELRSTLVFTGYHLVYNLLSDRLLRYGFSVQHDDTSLASEPHTYAIWAGEKVLNPPYHTDAILKFSRDSDGKAMGFAFADGDTNLPYSDCALVMPIGHMVRRLAISVHMRSNPARYGIQEIV